MAHNSSSSLRRVLSKCQTNIDNGNYYEAHQMYRTLYFRYNSQKKYDDAIELLHSGSVTLLTHDQFQSGLDLAMLMVDVYNKSMMPVTKDSTDKLINIFERLKINADERIALVSAGIKWSSKVDPNHHNGHPTLHQRFATIYWQEKNYVQSRYHFVHSDDGLGCAFMLIEHHTTGGYNSEVDLFITQTVLQYLCLQNKTTASTAFFTYTKQHPTIQTGPPFFMPLLNFVWLLLIALESPKLTVFAILCEQYEPSINRDPLYKEYLDRIGQVFFGLPVPKSPRGLFDSILQTFAMGDDETAAFESSIPTSAAISALDLD